MSEDTLYTPENIEKLKRLLTESMLNGGMAREDAEAAQKERSEEPAPTVLKLESKTVKMEEFPVKKCERRPDGTILIHFFDKDELEK